MRRPLSVPSVHRARPSVGRSRLPLPRRLLGARTALAYWAAVLALALITALVVSHLVDRAATAEHRFGALRPALVSTTAVRTGQTLSAANTELQDRPTAQLPPGALRRIPGGASASGPIDEGEVLTAARLNVGAASLPVDTASMSVPLGDAPLAVRPGDHVDVYATYDPALVPPGTEATSRVGVRAEVMRVTRTSVTLAVRVSEVRGFAAAVARSTITLALVR